MGTIFIAGSYGVGKSTLCDNLSRVSGVPAYSAGDLISCINGEQYGDGLWHVWVGQSMLPDHVRRIACDNMKRSCPENTDSLLNITLSDTDPVLQII